jgi:hypothetical protein
MGKKNTIPARIYPKLPKDLLNAGAVRVGKGLMKPREVTVPKMTELLTKTQGYRMSLEELKHKREKRK